MKMYVKNAFCSLPCELWLHPHNWREPSRQGPCYSKASTVKSCSPHMRMNHHNAIVSSPCVERKKLGFQKSVSHHQHQACTHRSRRAERQIVISFRYAGTTEGMLCYPNSTGHTGQSYIILTGVEQRPGIINSVYKELSRRDKTVIRIPNRVLVQLNCLQNLDLNSYENVQSLMSE